MDNKVIFDLIEVCMYLRPYESDTIETKHTFCNRFKVKRVYMIDC